jgi:hypothetical protein
MMTVLIAAAITIANAQAATAKGVCEAPYMHDGGLVHYQGAGNLQLSAELNFSEVTRNSAGNCRARVQGTATFSYAGLPASATKLDYQMTIKQGQAHFVRYGQGSHAAANDGPFDLCMLGLFAYEGGVFRAGQTFPGASYRLRVGKDAPMQGGNGTTVRIGVKTVGTQQTIDTLQGKQLCWPISYDRSTDPTMATFRTITLPIPALHTRVTDWYCPKPGVVMKQDIAQGNAISTVQLTQMR